MQVCIYSSLFFPDWAGVGNFAEARGQTKALSRTTTDAILSLWAVTFDLCYRKSLLAAAWRAGWWGDARGWSCEKEKMVSSNTQRHQELQKCCQNRKMLWTLAKLSSSPTFLFFFFQLKILLAWLFFPNSQSSPEVSQYGFIVIWGTVNLWQMPFAFWIYGNIWTVVSLEEHSETECFDFLNNFLRIIRNENSRAGWILPQQHAFQEVWFI